MSKRSCFCFKLSCRLLQVAWPAYVAKNAKPRSDLLSYSVVIFSYWIRRILSWSIVIRRRPGLLPMYVLLRLQGFLIGIFWVWIQTVQGCLLIFQLILKVLQCLLVIYQIFKGFLNIIFIVIAFLFNQVFSIGVMYSGIENLFYFPFFFIIIKFNLYFKLCIGQYWF